MVTGTFMPMTRPSFSAAALALLLASSRGAQSVPSPWPISTPSTVGLNPAVLDSIHAEIMAGKYGNIDRLLVSKTVR